MAQRRGGQTQVDAEIQRAPEDAPLVDQPAPSLSADPAPAPAAAPQALRYVAPAHYARPSSVTFHGDSGPRLVSVDEAGEAECPDGCAALFAREGFVPKA